MSGQSGGRRLCLSKLNDQLTCKLCGGYYIDATTIIECLHSFCRSCIVKYLENNKYCPICEVQVHKSKPLLNIRPDHTLQDIVYKLVPGCYQNEMRCRREFYSKHPESRNQATSPEARGEPIESHIYSADESLSLSLEYYNPVSKDICDTNVTKETLAKQPKRYLRCPAAVTVFHLQKLIRAKYGLSEAHRVDIMYKEEPLCSSYTLMDIMYIYHWRRKVPLHLSYRIFESSPKRIKLSEDNANYKKSLSNAGIDHVEPKDEQSPSREWKEVQLKISETGVMSVTDISGPETKHSIGNDHTGDQLNTLEETVTETAQNSEKVLKNHDFDETIKDAMQTALDINTRLNDSCNVASKTENVTGNNVKQCEKESSSQNVCIPVSNDRQEAKSEKKSPNATKISPAVKPDSPSSENDTTKTSTIENKCSVQTVKSQNSKDSCDSVDSKVVEESKLVQESKTDPDVLKEERKQVTTNNNTIRTESKTDNNRQNVKNLSETKSVNAGAKIDALSAKLQFQPKIGQVNNTYSKRTAKEKRTILHSLKKSENKTSFEFSKSTVDSGSAKSRVNCETSTMTTVTTMTSTASTTATTTTTAAKAAVPSVSVPVSTPQQKPTGFVQQTPNTTSSTQQTSLSLSSPGTQPTISVVSVSCGRNASEKSDAPCRNQNVSVTVQQALNSLDQMLNTSEQATKELSQRVSCASSTPVQKAQYVQRGNASSADSRVSLSLNVSTSTMSLTNPTFSYTVQDSGGNATVKSPTKTSTSCSVQKSPSDTADVRTAISCTLSDSPVCPMPRFSIQSSSMSIYSISTSVKSIYCGGNQTVGSAAVTTTVTATSKQPLTKPNVEITGVYSIPPCPDAIPISLMKPTVRKHEIIAKGTNLNEICAKIGTSGSKINDICAKIGENSKEKSKAEARCKAEIPDLLKIAKRCPPSPSTDSTVKHIPNIPNVPIYTPSNSTASTESKGVYSTKEANNVTIPVSQAVSASHGHRISLKKQSQPVGYKTLRDPPKSWNPTLSRNNYVAVKNQAKEMQNQSQTANSEGTNKMITSKPAKIFKMRNMPRYLGNPASGVKPMYGVTNETKEKEQPPISAAQKNTTLNMMKIDPKTLSPIVSTVNSPIVSPPPYSPNARSYQNTPFSRDICRNTGSPISPRNSPVNMLSTNPFIPSPTPNTNPRLIYSHFPPPFPDASRFPNPLIRSPIGIPPPSAFHSSLPPSINKLYQRSTSYMPQTTGSYSQPQTQPPTVQRIPPSTSSSPKSPKTSSPSSVATVSSSYNIVKSDMQTSSTVQTTSTGSHGALHLTKNAIASQQAINAFNLSKTGNSTSTSDFQRTSNDQPTTSSLPTTIETSSSVTTCVAATLTTSTSTSSSSSSSSASTTQTKQTNSPSIATVKTKSSQPTSASETDAKEAAARDEEPTKPATEQNESSDEKTSKRTKSTTNQTDKKDKSVSKVNGDMTGEQFNEKKAKEESDERKPAEKSSGENDKANSHEQNNTTKSPAVEESSAEKVDDGPQNEPRNDDLSKTNDQIQGKRIEAQRNKAES